MSLLSDEEKEYLNNNIIELERGYWRLKRELEELEEDVADKKRFIIESEKIIDKNKRLLTSSQLDEEQSELLRAIRFYIKRKKQREQENESTPTKFSVLEKIKFDELTRNKEKEFLLKYISENKNV